MQYMHYYVCFHVDKHGDKGKELTSKNFIDATEEVRSGDEFFLLADPMHTLKNLVIKKQGIHFFIIESAKYTRHKR